MPKINTNRAIENIFMFCDLYLVNNIFVQVFSSFVPVAIKL